ncbi:MAG: phosphotransferase [Betaproteobacteria bacterium]|nr:phosphotransferase [Betaproteobacteria bacterium]MDE2002975.1 phosphotransferase [Betaproteobacteria bacterium]MDE2210670.1 phosphotransferase [Betaproteobacteria bacterium]
MSSESSADPRQDALCHWLDSTLRLPDFAIAPASSDASFRRYFRVSLAAPCERAQGEATLIAMDAPPPQEDCRPFVHVAKLLGAAGVHAPRVLAFDLERGFLLLTDLGSTTYASALDDASAHALYLDAFDALVRWQSATREDELPPYDEALLRRELMLFLDWYVARHVGRTPAPSERATLDAAFAALIANALSQPRVYVHRDYHSRNLMLCTPNPGVLDFQDAVLGPITYDLVSLLRDAYIEWSEERELDWAIRYWERARKARLPVAADFTQFWRDYEWMGVQRQLKVLGIFARLKHRDGKDRYVNDMPRVLRYLRRACARYREFAALSRLLDSLEGRAPDFVYSL